MVLSRLGIQKTRRNIPSSTLADIVYWKFSFLRPFVLLALRSSLSLLLPQHGRLRHDGGGTITEDCPSLPEPPRIVRLMGPNVVMAGDYRAVDAVDLCWVGFVPARRLCLMVLAAASPFWKPAIAG